MHMSTCEEPCSLDTSHVGLIMRRRVGLTARTHVLRVWLLMVLDWSLCGRLQRSSLSVCRRAE